jgi:hypothetical protein
VLLSLPLPCLCRYNAVQEMACVSLLLLANLLSINEVEGVLDSPPEDDGCGIVLLICCVWMT